MIDDHYRWWALVIIIDDYLWWWRQIIIDDEHAYQDSLLALLAAYPETRPVLHKLEDNVAFAKAFVNCLKIRGKVNGSEVKNALFRTDKLIVLLLKFLI